MEENDKLEKEVKRLKEDNKKLRKATKFLKEENKRLSGELEDSGNRSEMKEKMTFIYRVGENDYSKITVGFNMDTKEAEVLDIKDNFTQYNYKAMYESKKIMTRHISGLEEE